MPGDEELQRRVNEVSELARQYGGLVGIRGEEEDPDMEAVWIRFERLDHPEGEIQMRLGDREVVLMNANALKTAMERLWFSAEDERGGASD